MKPGHKKVETIKQNIPMTTKSKNSRIRDKYVPLNVLPIQSIYLQEKPGREGLLCREAEVRSFLFFF